MLIKFKVSKIKSECFNKVHNNTNENGPNMKQENGLRLGSSNQPHRTMPKSQNDMIDSPILVRKTPKEPDENPCKIKITKNNISNLLKLVSFFFKVNFDEKEPLQLDSSPNTFKRKKKISFVANV